MRLTQRVRSFLSVEGFTTTELLRMYFKSAICSALFRLRGVQSPAVCCQGRLPVLYAHGLVSIGERFSMRAPIFACELGADRKDARLEIGNRVFINQGTMIVATNHVKIGDDTLIGEFSSIYDTNHHAIDPAHPTRSAPVIIGNDVWLCRGAVVLPGSNIGDHTVVAAGSVVNGDLPPCVLAAGNPAQVVRKLDIPEGWSRRENLFSFHTAGIS